MSPTSRVRGWEGQRLAAVLGPESVCSLLPRRAEMCKAGLQTGFICFLLEAVRPCFASLHRLWEPCREPPVALPWPGEPLCAASFLKDASL